MKDRDPEIWPPSRSAMKRSPSRRRRQDCIDCGIDTSFGTGNGHYYTVHDAVWREAVPDGEGQLCLDCLERRLGRPLTRADFVRTPYEIAKAMTPPEGHAEWCDAMWERQCRGLPEIAFEEWRASTMGSGDK
jgi:hypothetical protein